MDKNHGVHVAISTVVCVSLAACHGIVLMNGLVNNIEEWKWLYNIEMITYLSDVCLINSYVYETCYVKCTWKLPSIRDCHDIKGVA